MTIEDETGVANAVIFRQLFDIYRKEILQSRLIMVQGKVQKQGQIIHVIVKECFDFTKLLKKLTPSQNEQLPLLTLAHGDEKTAPYHAQNNGSQKHDDTKSVFPSGRNFK